VLTSMSGMLCDAQRRGVAIGYFESWNLESTRAVAMAAEEERSPLIVGFNGGFLDAHGYELEYYANIGKAAIDLSTVPATLLLNEVSGYDQTIRAIRLGFSAVMIDVSSHPFDEAIKLTRRIVDVAHSAGVCVESQFDELPEAKNGILEKAEDICMTDPAKAARFVRETGVDALSVSVGNVHGLYRQKAKLNLPLVKEIREAIDTPLVLHGATGISENDARKAARSGVCKINIGHALRLAFAREVKRRLDVRVMNLESVSDSAAEKMKEIIKGKMRVYGSAAFV